jgi:hypothetical protein
MLAMMCAFAANAANAELAITNTSCDSIGNLTFGWAGTTGNVIIEKSVSLSTDNFQCVSDVFSANHVSVPNDSMTAFYRIREVKAINIPDSNLWTQLYSAVTNMWGKKVSPSSEIYDFEIEGISNLFSASSSISNAAGIEALTSLASIDLSHNCFENLNLSSFPSLSALDLDFNGNLKYLVCTNNQLTVLGLYNCGLTNLNCSWNQLSDVPFFGGNTGLVILDISHNNLSALGLTASFQNLQSLNCSYNQLSVLTVPPGPLRILDCSYNDLLTDLNCTNNYLACLNVAGCVALTNVNCSSNRLPNLDFSSNAALRQLVVANNLLTNLNLPGASLRYLDCSRNRLPMLDLSACHPVIMNCASNRLKDLVITGPVRSVDLSWNILTNADVSACVAITNLNPSHNLMSDLSLLVSNAARGGLGAGDVVYLQGNPLNSYAQTNQIPYLTNQGVTVYYP